MSSTELKPCIRLEPDGKEPAGVYCSKYSALYQEIADRLNDGQFIGTSITGADGMYLLNAEIRGSQVTFDCYNYENQRSWKEKTPTLARPFSVLEEIARKAGFRVKVQIPGVMEEKYCYQPTPEELEGERKLSASKPSYTGISALSSKPVVPNTPSRISPDTLEMPKYLSPARISRERSVDTDGRATPTLVLPREPAIPPGYPLSREVLNQL